MKLKTTKELRIGDWIVEGAGLKGKFRIAKVKEILLSDFEEIDLDAGTIKLMGKKSANGEDIGAIKSNDGLIRVLNSKEIKALQILRIKLKTLNSLEDKKVIDDKW
jgi:hypothetical protein